MLSTPKHGWSKISIGDWSDRCSYLDDVPFKLLHTMERVLNRKYPVAVDFDAEGYEYIIVFSCGIAYIISGNTEGDKDILFEEEVSYQKLARELIDDIRRDIDGWAVWPPHNWSEEDKERRKTELLDRCKDVEALLQKR